MVIRKVELAATAVKKSQYPDDDLPEIALAGRSNVGKSSLLNLLLNRRRFARVSGTPGKTRTINFYEINDKFRIVDLPGYGYAKASRSITETWGGMVESYLNGRKGLLKIFQLVDIRHDPTAMDVQMYEYLKFYKLDGIVVATKADKIPKSETGKRINAIRKILDMSEDDKVIPVSALKKTGHEALQSEIEVLCNSYFSWSSERG